MHTVRIKPHGVPGVSRDRYMRGLVSSVKA